jgi:hypothetical protein
MATLAANQDQRANDIIVFYTGISTYNAQTTADIPFQQDFAAFNDLITLYHNELKTATGYASDSTAYMPDATGVVGSAPWWTNADVKNQTSELFFIDSTTALSLNVLYILNGQITPSQRNYFSAWNQYIPSNILGGYNHFGFQNATDKSSYSSVTNPFQTGVNFLMGEPVEYYGNTNNLEWGQIVFDGQFSYRNRYIGDSTSYTSHADTGFNNYERSGVSIGNFVGAFTTANPWPSPFEIFAFTYWGDGSNTSNGSVDLFAHTGGSSGSFNALDGGLFAPGAWYSLYSASDVSKGWIFFVTGVAPNYFPAYPTISSYTYSYINADWPIPPAGAFDDTYPTFVNPFIDQTVKTGAASDGRRNIWTAVYNIYYTRFSNALNAITTQANSWLATLTPITSFDYTLIIANALSALGLADTQAFATTLQNWINDWSTLIHGGTFSILDANWSNANLSGLLTSGSGGLNLMLNFTTDNYTSTQTGILPTRRTQVYTLLGHYILGSLEFWNPIGIGQISQIINNNTGNFSTSSLYFYRFSFIDDRLNRVAGTLTQAYSGYVSYNTQLANISTLEVNMTSQTIDHQYDVTPSGFVTTTNEADQIVITWDATKAAASYNIDRKQGISGTWVRIATKFEYVEPTQPISAVPPSPIAEYDDPAYTFGHQGFGLTISNPNAFTGLNDDFTIYDFNLAIDGAAPIDIPFKGMDAKTWNGFVTTLQNQFTATNIGVTPSVVTDLILTSNLPGNGSTISITPGTTNDLLAALSTTPSAAVAGVSALFAGNVYYYRLRVCNGWDGAVSVSPPFPDQVSYTRTDISFASSDNSINTVAGNFVTAGFVVGQTATITGSATNNLTTAVIKTVIANKIVLINARLVNESAGASDTVIAAVPTTENWLSQSQYEYTAYVNTTDKFTNGEAGTITWDPPTNLITTNTITHVALNWTADVTANTYNIYRATSLNGGYALIASSATNSYNDATGIPGFVYYYKISSVASTNNKLYDSVGNFLSTPIQSTLTIAGVPGNILWQTITLSASTTDSSKLTLSWSTLSGATGYVIYKSMTQTGQYTPLSNDDGTPMVINATSYVDAQPAQQYFVSSFTSPTDGIAFGTYTPLARYYFIVICSGLSFEQTVQQYYITAPASGIWTAQTISNSIQTVINSGLKNVNSNLIALTNPVPTTYRIKLSTVAAGTQTTISILNGTFGPSLLPLLGGISPAEAGTGAYVAVPAFYQVAAVQVVLGSIVRQSVLSNVAQGVIPPKI